MNDLHGADLDAFAALNAFILIHFGEELGNLDCLDRANFFAFFTADAAGSAGGAYASAAVVAGAGDIYCAIFRHHFDKMLGASADAGAARRALFLVNFDNAIM